MKLLKPTKINQSVMTPEIDVVVDISGATPSTSPVKDSGDSRDDISVPPVKMIVGWAHAALEEIGTSLCIRIVGRDEMQSLNHEFANKQSATNVLSFPTTETDITFPEEVTGSTSENDSVVMDFPPWSLGDIAICASIVNDEARDQQKTPYAHWAHMVVHGVLHLRGFDHQEETQAKLMEQKERDILATLGFADPYDASADMTLRSGNPSYG